MSFEGSENAAWDATEYTNHLHALHESQAIIIHQFDSNPNPNPLPYPDVHRSRKKKRSRHSRSPSVRRSPSPDPPPRSPSPAPDPVDQQVIPWISVPLESGNRNQDYVDDEEDLLRHTLLNTRRRFTQNDLVRNEWDEDFPDEDDDDGDEEEDGDSLVIPRPPLSKEFILERLLYWKLRDKKWCFLCYHGRNQDDTDKYAAYEGMIKMVQLYWGQVDRKIIGQKLVECYEKECQPLMKPRRLDKKTRLPRPPRHWWVATALNHFEEHHLLPIIQKENCYRKACNAEQILSTQVMKRLIGTGEIIVDPKGMKLWETSVKSRMFLEKDLEKARNEVRGMD